MSYFPYEKTSGVERWVSTEGNDTTPSANINLPTKTISTAISGNGIDGLTPILPGYKLNILAGLYNEPISLNNKQNFTICGTSKQTVLKNTVSLAGNCDGLELCSFETLTTSESIVVDTTAGTVFLEDINFNCAFTSTVRFGTLNFSSSLTSPANVAEFRNCNFSGATKILLPDLPAGKFSRIHLYGSKSFTVDIGSGWYVYDSNCENVNYINNTSNVVNNSTGGGNTSFELSGNLSTTLIDPTSIQPGDELVYINTNYVSPITLTVTSIYNYKAVEGATVNTISIAPGGTLTLRYKSVGIYTVKARIGSDTVVTKYYNTSSSMSVISVLSNLIWSDIKKNDILNITNTNATSSITVTSLLFNGYSLCESASNSTQVVLKPGYTVQLERMAVADKYIVVNYYNKSTKTIPSSIASDSNLSVVGSTLQIGDRLIINNSDISSHILTADGGLSYSFYEGFPLCTSTLVTIPSKSNAILLKNSNSGFIVESIKSVSSYVGDMKISIKASNHEGWYALNGQTLDRVTHSDLFSVIGTSFGTGNGTTTFNLPDMRGRVAGSIGLGSGLTNRTLGLSIGEESHKLLVSEVPSHSHTGSTSSGGLHYHDLDTPATSLTGDALGGNGGDGLSDASVSTKPAGDHAHSITTNSVGGDGSHNNMQPTLFLGTWFIWSGV